MPYINVKVTGGPEAPTTEQKAQIIAGVTDVMVRVLGKNPASTVVVIEEVPLENWGMGGINTIERRRRAQQEKK